MKPSLKTLILALCIAAVTFSMASAQQGELVLWDMPFSSAFPGGIALDNGLLYVAANGAREIIRLDPSQDQFRSWGVSEHPQDVIVVDGVVFCTVRPANHISYFNPESLGTTTSRLPFTDADMDEIHRGQDTTDGNTVLWIANRHPHGFLRYEYDAAQAPVIAGSPSDYAATRATSTIELTTEAVEYEKFSYDITLIPDPFPLDIDASSTPYTQWTIPVEEDVSVTDLAVADDGTLWVSAGLPFLFKYDPVAETIQMLETIQNVMIFQGLLSAADGSIWFSNIVEGSIGHLNPATGLSEVWRIQGVTEIYDLAFDSAGNIWFTDRIGGTIGKLSPAINESVLYPLGEDSEPLFLLVDDADIIWFSAGGGNFVGRLNPSP